MIVKLLKPLIAIVIGSVIMASCSSDSSSLHRISTSQTKGTTNSQLSHQIAGTPTISESSLVSSLFVATSAEYNNSHYQNQWYNFITSMRDKLVSSCLVNYGFTSEEVAFIADARISNNPTDNIDYPDVARLSQGDLAVSGSPINSNIPRSNIPASEKKIWNADFNKCYNVKLPGLAKIVSQLVPIDAMWGRDQNSVWTNNSVVSALHTWTTCVANNGIPNMPSTYLGLSEFFGKIDNLRITHPNLTYSSPQIVSLVKIYGKCIKPVVTAMDNVRLHDRQILLAKYASQLNVIAKEMNNSISVDSSKYGLNI